MNVHPIDWSTVFARAAPLELSLPILALITAAAIALSVPRATWRWFGLFTTLVHELGHAVAAVVTGNVVHGIRIRLDHSGETRSRGRRGFGMNLSTAMGYPAPALTGAALVWSVLTGYTSVALFASGVVLLITLLVIRNLLGVLVVLASTAVTAGLWWLAPHEVQSYVLVVIGIALLVGSVRGLATVVAVHTRRRERLPSSDAYLLARSTGIPSFVWLALFALLIGAAIAFTIWGYGDVR